MVSFLWYIYRCSLAAHWLHWVSLWSFFEVSRQKPSKALGSTEGRGFPPVVLIGFPRHHTLFRVCWARELEMTFEPQVSAFPWVSQEGQESGYAQLAQGVRRWFEGPGWRRVPCWHGDSAWESWIHAIIFCSWGRKGKSYILRFSQIKMRNKSIPFCHWPRALTQNDSRSQSFFRQWMQLKQYRFFLKTVKSYLLFHFSWCGTDIKGRLFTINILSSLFSLGSNTYI